MGGRGVVFVGGRDKIFWFAENTNKKQRWDFFLGFSGGIFLGKKSKGGGGRRGLKLGF